MILLAFLGGTMFGAAIGVVLMAILAAGSRDDDDRE